jgi:hypothetical protein
MKTRMATMYLLACSIGALTLAACSTAPKSAEGKADIERDAMAALERAERTDPSLTPIFSRAEGYAIFPSVGKGAVGVGGAYGKGVLFDRGRAVGYCDLTQGTIGLQLGGQSYTEIIGFGRGGQGRSWRGHPVHRWCGGLHDGRGGADVRGLYRWAEIQLPAQVIGPVT